MRQNWGVIAVAIVAITAGYFFFSYSLWELLPLYRRLRRKGIEAELEGLEPGEHLLDEARLPSGEGRLVWLGLTERRLLALRHGPRPSSRVEVLEEIALEEIGELRERTIPPSLGMVLSGAGLGGLGALLMWKASDLWVLLLVLGALVLAGGLTRIRYYDLFQEDKPLPNWSFNSQGPGRFRAKRFAEGLKRQLPAAPRLTGPSRPSGRRGAVR